MATGQMELSPVTAQMQKRPPSALALMQVALERGQVEQLQILQEMHFKEMARNAEVEFNLAMNAVQSELGRIAPDLTNPQTKSKYASYAALDRAIRPIYTKHGFSLSFDSGDSQPETVVAYCYVSHRDGHTRKYQSPPMPSDGKGARGGDVMTKTHATGAAMSYAMRYLLKFIFNIAIGEEDSDGNGPAPEWLETYLQLMDECQTLDGLQDTYKRAYKEADNRGDTDALKRLVVVMTRLRNRIQKQGKQG